MNKYWYKFNGGKKPIETSISEECPSGFIGFTDGSCIDWTSNDYINDILTPIIPPEPPAPYVRTLADAKTEKKTSLKSIRDFKEANDGFVYLEKTFDSDDRSITRLMVAVTAAQTAIINNTVFSNITWTLKDNSTIELTAQQLAEAPIAIAITKGKLHETYRTLCDVTLEAATTIEEVDAVVWTEV